MPVRDVDGGLVWGGYSPRTLTGRLPKETYNTVPIEFGASNLRAYTKKGFFKPQGLVFKVRK
jgi:hypothetical protein